MNLWVVKVKWKCGYNSKVFGSPETFSQKGFWPPEADALAGWAWTFVNSFSCSLAHPGVRLGIDRTKLREA